MHELTNINVEKLSHSPKSVKVFLKDQTFEPRKSRPNDAAYDIRLNIECTSALSKELLERIIDFHKGWIYRFPDIYKDCPNVYIDADNNYSLKSETLISILEKLYISGTPYLALPPGQYFNSNVYEHITKDLPNTQLVGTGVFLELPPDYHALILPRSGLGLRHQLTLANTIGLIDSNYRGEVKLALQNLGRSIHIFTSKEKVKIAQMLIQSSAFTSIDITTEPLSSTERGGEGFGSSGL